MTKEEQIEELYSTLDMNALTVEQRLMLGSHTRILASLKKMLDDHDDAFADELEQILECQRKGETQ